MNSNIMLKNIARPVAYPAIDGIRFYAALVVVFEHLIGGIVTEYFRIPGASFSYASESSNLRFWFYWGDGNHGVDVFFLISGFLMARIVLNQSEFNYFQFLKNRFLRIYPAFLLSLVVATLFDCLLFGWEWNPIEFAKSLIFMNAIQGLVSLPYNHVTWSLGYEFAFYTVIPGLLLLKPFLGKQRSALLALALSLLFMPNLTIRANGLFLGAVIGSIEDASLIEFSKRIPLTGILLVYLSIGIFHGMLLIPYIYFYYPMLGAAALLLVKIIWDTDCELHKFFCLPAMRWLGTISYSIYLFQSVSIEVVLTYIAPRPASTFGAVIITFAGLGLTILTANFVYLFVERRYFVSGTHSKIKA